MARFVLVHGGWHAAGASAGLPRNSRLAGHSPFFTQPDELADMLGSLA